MQAIQQFGLLSFPHSVFSQGAFAIPCAPGLHHIRATIFRHVSQILVFGMIPQSAAVVNFALWQTFPLPFFLIWAALESDRGKDGLAFLILA
jgi:hypothetical protein